MFTPKYIFSHIHEMDIDTPSQPAHPLTFDLGHLLATDPSPLPALSDPSTKETLLASRAQHCAQGLINQLLTACPIQRSSEGDLHIKLPDPSTQLPREKPVPKEKEKTKWEKFAEKKGIKAKRKDGKLKFDEGKGEWVAKYGFKGKKGERDGGVQADWVTEVDERAEREGAEDGGGNKAKKQRKK